jgi:hypothetical protein
LSACFLRFFGTSPLLIFFLWGSSCSRPRSLVLLFSFSWLPLSALALLLLFLSVPILQSARPLVLLPF